MNTGTPTLSDLFTQLGLAMEEAEIDAFIDKNKGLAKATRIEDADFWNASQADFIRSALIEDAEWAEVIDQLNSRLR